MGARPSPKKPADKRLGHHKRTELIVVAQPLQSGRIPPLPRSYEVGVRKAWRDFWQSASSIPVDRTADMPALLRWAWLSNELAVITPVIEKSRLVTGSMGQLTLNPLAGYAQQLRMAIQHIEIEFGMTVLARSRLGMTIKRPDTATSQPGVIKNGAEPVDPRRLLSAV